MGDIRIDKDTDVIHILNEIPENPGVYMYSDENATIIYIGKAKSLRKRIYSYFTNTKNMAPKTRVMVRKIRKIDYLVVKSEEEAFLLENNLIKQYKPRYNTMLKDDKTYPWLVVQNESFSRVYLTRKKVNDGSRYYGPYASINHVKSLLRLITALYPIRTCSYGLSSENIEKRKYKTCLQYHLKKCLAPCVGFQTEMDYNKNVESIEKILNGNSKEVSELLYKEMMKLSSELRFEDAAIVKEKYNLLELHFSKTVVASPTINNIEVFSFEENEVSAYVNYMYLVHGSIIQNCTIEYKKRLEESKESILGMAIVELRSRFESKAREVLLPFFPDINIKDVTFFVPNAGEKKKLLRVSEKNLRQYTVEQLTRVEKLNLEVRIDRILNTLKNELRLKDLPVYIECFDNSNIQGTNPVAACVVFKEAKPSKSDYRHYNIKTVQGPDDFHSMYEVVFRRYRRLITEKMPLPQLIVIDGGKGQLHAAVDALKDLGIYGKIAIIGIAERLEEIYFPNDSIPVYLNKNSEGLKLIQKVRDEAHRFGITLHRNKRSKGQINSELDMIKGVGPILKETLLVTYGSVKRIKRASKKELIELIGEKRAEEVFRVLNMKE